MVKVGQNMVALIGCVTQVGRNVGENCIFTEIVLNDLRNVGIHRFVVCNARTRRIDQGHSPRTVNLHQAIDTQTGVGSETRWVKEIVVDSARSIIDNDLISTEIALSRMKRISEFKGLYSALAIVCFSCDDMHGKVDELYDEIVRDWEKR